MEKERLGWMDVGVGGGGVSFSGIPWAALCFHLSHVWQALFHSELAESYDSLQVGLSSRTIDLPMWILRKTACQQFFPARRDFDEEDAGCRPLVRAPFVLAC